MLSDNGVLMLFFLLCNKLCSPNRQIEKTVYVKWEFQSEIWWNDWGNSRCKEQCAVQQWAVVVVLNEVIHLTGFITHLRFMQDLHLHRIFDIVEVYHVDVKDQYGRTWDVLTWPKQSNTYCIFIFWMQTGITSIYLQSVTLA